MSSSVLRQICVGLTTNPDVKPLFVHRNVWRYIEGGGELKYGRLNDYINTRYFSPAKKSCGRLRHLLYGVVGGIRMLGAVLCVVPATGLAN